MGFEPAARIPHFAREPQRRRAAVPGQHEPPDRVSGLLRVRGARLFGAPFRLFETAVFLVDFLYKTTARIKIHRLDVTFVALGGVGNEIAFRRRGDFQVARNEFLQNC